MANLENIDGIRVETVRCRTPGATHGLASHPDSANDA
ncbi:hypothetical protein SAMN04489832_1494 [Micromonospora cremea]|uniref:Uncharacterized protein n=1 Tax=Micromonospora cremea TaxID=709881 RepID=A0A1N5VCL1_9ACTN|nr:hypothetical protein SAMN04489832_1494 [Micromonospora cremea]